MTACKLHILKVLLFSCNMSCYKIQNSVSLHVLCQFSIALFMKQLCIFQMASVFIFLIPFVADNQISHFRFPLLSISHLIHQSGDDSTAPPCATKEPVHVSLEDILCYVSGNNEYKINISFLCCT